MVMHYAFCIVYLRAQVKKYHLDKVVEIVPGGRRGQDSIYNGLVCARRHYADDTIVLIHDGVRPLAMNLSLGPGPVIGSASHLLSPTAYEGKADYVFHLAGNASPYFINSDPVGIMKCNLLGTINVLEYARDCQTKKVIFASTREVYGKNEEAELLDEQAYGTLDPLDDRSCYPESKRAAETLLKNYFLQYGVNFNAIRIAHSYGPTMKLENDGRVMADLMGDVVAGRDIVLKSSGEAIRAFLYVTDAVVGMFTVLFYGEPAKAYNLANETEPVSIKDLAHMLAALRADKKIQVVISEGGQKGYCAYRRTALDTSALEQLGWSPQISLHEALPRLLTYHTYHRARPQ